MDTENSLQIPYFIGLDMGTTSVGWAVTDVNYKIIRKNKKALWGVRIFPEASTAAARRIARSTRRRLRRQKQRIDLLQQYFANPIGKIDPVFFQRLKDSFFFPDDKVIKQRFSLFNDSDFTDIDFYEKYPTIYHLRYALMQKDAPSDPRLIYLAMHHMMKNRGHFLYQGERFNPTGQFDLIFETFYSALLNLSETSFDNFEEYKEQLKTILPDQSQSPSKRAQQLNANIKDDVITTINKILVGNTGNLSILFNDESLEEIPSNKFKFEGYDEKRPELVLILEERIDLIDAAYEIFNWARLKRMLKEAKSISEARIAIYEKHKTDLAKLKIAYKTLGDDSYKKFFRTSIRTSAKDYCNYVAYTRHFDHNGKNMPILLTCTQDEILTTIKKDLSKYVENSSIIPEILNECEKGTFLPKIITKDNGVIPYQLHLMELEMILQQAKKHHSEWLTDEITQRISQIFAFRLPYYIGPLNDKSPFAWLVRRSHEPVRPWNMKDVIDIPQTAENFINNLIGKCTYLPNEDVLPKNSLLYAEYMVRNILNTITVNEHRLEDEVRETLYKDLFLKPVKSGKITRKRILYALKDALNRDVQDFELGGMDLEIPARLTAANDFCRIGIDSFTDKEKEDIILKITAYSDGGAILKEWINKTYGDRLTEEQIDALARLKYKDWGRLSRRLLSGIRVMQSDGIEHSVIEMMRMYPLNLMELIGTDGYGFKSIIEEMKQGGKISLSDLCYDRINELYVSPPVKRMIWQTLRIIREITKIMGRLPKKVFIEVAREEEEKKRTTSRKDQLRELYKNCLHDTKKWGTELSELKELSNNLESTEDDRLKAKRLYLYYLQQGRCMYSGEVINIADIWDQNLYDIDHIYPRSITKDDSFSNLVLVKRSENQKKGDDYPLSNSIRSNMTPFWKTLCESEYISKGKYERLVRSTLLTNEELGDFIARQLVETRQSTKAAAEILKELLPDSSIVYVKAVHVSDFRYRHGVRAEHEKDKPAFYFPKVRALNDLHHAKDAYLNIVVGNVYDTKFTSNPKHYMQTAEKRSYNLVKLFDYDVKSPTGEIGWKAGIEGTIQTVSKMMRRNNILCTYQSYCQKGEFYDQLIVKRGNGQAPIKSDNPALQNIDRYGGFNKLTGSHFAVISHKKGNKIVKEFVSIPVLLLKNKPGFEERLMQHLKKEEYIDPIIIESTIKYWAIVEKNGERYRLLAKTGTNLKVSADVQPFFSDQLCEVYKQLERYSKKEASDEGLELQDALIVDLSYLFDDLVKRLTEGVSSIYPSLKTLGNDIKVRKNLFVNLSAKDQLEVINAILLLVHHGPQLTDLTKIGKAKNSGKITITMNMGNDTVVLIFPSITGFYERRKKL